MKIRGMIQHPAVFYITLQPLPSFDPTQDLYLNNITTWYLGALCMKAPLNLLTSLYCRLSHKVFMQCSLTSYFPRAFSTCQG